MQKAGLPIPVESQFFLRNILNVRALMFKQLAFLLITWLCWILFGSAKSFQTWHLKLNRKSYARVHLSAHHIYPVNKNTL